MRSHGIVSLVLLAALGASAPASAYLLFQSPEFSPIQPTESAPLVAHVSFYACAPPPQLEVVRSGALIELRFEDASCPIDPIPGQPLDVSVGLLPAGTYDVRLVATNDPEDPQVEDERIVVVAPRPCPSDALCLLDGRFAITADWTDYDGHVGVAQPAPLTDESGTFWFFADSNYELMVKTVDGCAVNGNVWLYAGGLTDVRVTLHVRDTQLGTTRDYTSPLGTPYAPLGETAAFPCAIVPAG